jgi:hypothetical protein
MSLNQKLIFKILDDNNTWSFLSLDSFMSISLTCKWTRFLKWHKNSNKCKGIILSNAGWKRLCDCQHYITLSMTDYAIAVELNEIFGGCIFVDLLLRYFQYFKHFNSEHYPICDIYTMQFLKVIYRKLRGWRICSTCRFMYFNIIVNCSLCLCSKNNCCKLCMCPMCFRKEIFMASMDRLWNNNSFEKLHLSI